MASHPFLEQIANHPTRWKKPEVPAPDDPSWVECFNNAPEPARGNLARAWLTYAAEHWEKADGHAAAAVTVRYLHQNVGWARAIRPYFDALFWEDEFALSQHTSLTVLHTFFTGADRPVLVVDDDVAISSWLIFGTAAQQTTALHQYITTPHAMRGALGQIALDLFQGKMIEDPAWTSLVWYAAFLRGYQNVKGDQSPLSSSQLELWRQLGFHDERPSVRSTTLQDYGIMTLPVLHAQLQALPSHLVAEVLLRYFQHSLQGPLEGVKKHLKEDSFLVSLSEQRDVFATLRMWVPQATALWDTAEVLGVGGCEACQMVIQQENQATPAAILPAGLDLPAA